MLLIHSLRAAGAERVTAMLANHWSRAGRRICVVTLTPAGRDEYSLDAGVTRVGLDVAGNSTGPLDAVARNLGRVRAVRRVLQRESPDVALAMMSTTSVLLALASAGMRGATLVGTERIHPPQLPLGPGWEALRAASYGLLDAVVVLTRDSAQWVATHTSARRVRVIPNAVVWPVPAGPPAIAPASLGAPGRRRLLAVGRLEPQKGFDRLIDIFGRLAPDFPDWELVLLGEGPDRAPLEARVQALGLHGVVLLPGRAGNMAEWYEAADLFVLSSRFEGFPNALAEAMAHGLPVLSVDCATGPRELIRNGVDGLLVPAGAWEDLERALRLLMREAALRERLRMRAVEVRERFALPTVDALWDQLFRECA